MSKTAAAKKKGSASEGEDDVVRKPGTSTLEWGVAGVSFLLLVAVILYLLVSAVTESHGPAQIVVRPLGVTAMADHFVVEFEAENLAGQSVAAITIAGELRDGAETVEEISVMLDYLPRNSVRIGAFIFRENPAGHDLVLTATSYAAP